MSITLPGGTKIEGTRDELAPYLPRVNWDGSLSMNGSVANDAPSNLANGCPDPFKMYGNITLCKGE